MTEQKAIMIIVFELIFNIFMSSLFSQPQLVMPDLPDDDRALRYNIRLAGSFLFLLFEDWIVKNVDISNSPSPGPAAREGFLMLGKPLSPRLQAAAY